MELEITENAQKLLFARGLLEKPGDAFGVALRIFHPNTGRAMEVSRSWPTDPIVKQYMDAQLEDQGDEAFLPTKADLSRQVWAIGISDNIPVDDRLKALRLYGDIRGFMQKDGLTVNNNMMMSNKVMLVRTSATEEDWEKELADQQRKLIDAAYTSQ